MLVLEYLESCRCAMSGDLLNYVNDIFDLVIFLQIYKQSNNGEKGHKTISNVEIREPIKVEPIGLVLCMLDTVFGPEELLNSGSFFTWCNLQNVCLGSILCFVSFPYQWCTNVNHIV